MTMAQLAINGHPTRGREVIEILEMMGGKQFESYNGNDINWCYTIIDGLIDWDYPSDKYKVFSLEEFLEKFPYKVGDKVQHNGATSCGSVYVIEQMKWEDNQVKYVICDLYWKNCKCTVISKDLQPYKEETMEERQYKELRMPLDDDDKLATEATIDGNKILPPNGYLIGKITQVDNGMLVEYVKQQPQFPKFNINTLKPFESRVLVRADNYNLWKPALFGFINSGAFYVLGGNAYRQCIPYESNEHLLNTTDDCYEFYKTWKK